MALPAFDTLQIFEDLEKAGFDEPQAKAISAVVRRVHDSSDVATKQDIAELRHEIGDLRKDIDTRLANMKFELLRWFFGIALAQTGLLVALKLWACVNVSTAAPLLTMPAVKRNTRQPCTVAALYLLQSASKPNARVCRPCVQMPPSHSTAIFQSGQAKSNFQRRSASKRYSRCGSGSFATRTRNANCASSTLIDCRLPLRSGMSNWRFWRRNLTATNGSRPGSCTLAGKRADSGVVCAFMQLFSAFRCVKRAALRGEPVASA